MTSSVRHPLWRLATLFATSSLFATSLRAQETRPVAATQATERVLARVIAKQTNPRCFASPKSPTYTDVLVEGDVVVVGPAVGDFRPVTLALGPTGYVSKRYTTAPAQGMVKTNGRGVAFRYRIPKAGEAPATQLPDSAELHLLGEDGEWWLVRSPAVVAYLPLADLTILPGEPAAAEAALNATAARRTGEWTTASAAFERAAAEAKLLGERRTKLEEVQRKIAAETRKPVESQDYAVLKKELEDLAGAIPAGSDEAARLALLQTEIKRQLAVVEVVKLKNDPPVRVTPSEDIRPDVPDPLGSRATAVGWLRARRGNPGWEVEKGGVVLYLVGCTSGRYDLSVFEGSEIAISGSADRPGRDSVRVLEAQNIEVIAPKGR